MPGNGEDKPEIAYNCGLSVIQPCQGLKINEDEVKK